jgi:hypothetical protein
MTRAAWLALIAIAAGCQGSHDPAPAPPPAPAGSGSQHVEAAPGDARDPADDPPATPDEVAAELPAGFDFDKLDHDAKVRFMRAKVLPPMRVAFQKFDAEKFANFGCKTCHGKNAAQRKYKMPNPDLPALDFAAIERGQQKPQVVNFMSRVVKPQIAKIFDRPQGWAFQPGHGCLECHVEKK